MGEYVGDGMGETEDTEYEDIEVEAYPMDTNPEASINSENSTNLIFFYDCETTGFSIYDDHIIEVAAKVWIDINPIPCSKPSYSSLVRTPRNIPRRGKCNNQ